MYFVFLKKGVVVDVLCTSETPNQAGIADHLLNGTADEVKQVETFAEVKSLLNKDTSENPAEKFFENIGKKLETFVNKVCDALEKKKTATTDTEDLIKTAKAVGEGVQGVVKQIKKAQARKKSEGKKE